MNLRDQVSEGSHRRHPDISQVSDEDRKIHSDEDEYEDSYEPKEEHKKFD